MKKPKHPGDYITKMNKMKAKVGKMTLKKFEGSAMDKKMDKAGMKKLKKMPAKKAKAMMKKK